MINIVNSSNEITKKPSKKKRIDWVDCAKGIAIIAVIIGHTVMVGIRGAMIRRVIFSFHMPLFFIFSCYTYKAAHTITDFYKNMKKSFLHLIIPGVLLYIVSTASHGIIEQYAFSNFESFSSFLLDQLYVLFYASGISVYINDSFEIGAIGIPWFLFALFVGRTLFDFIQLYCHDLMMFFICCLLSIVGVYLGSHYWLPFSGDIALAVMPLFFVGYYLPHFDLDRNPAMKFILFFTVWLITLIIMIKPNMGYLELACRRYHFYPLCFITAISGVLALSEACILLKKTIYLFQSLVFLGKNSMIMLAIHTLDFIWKPIWYVEYKQYYSMVYRVIIDIVILLLYKTFMKYIYRRNKENREEVETH